MSALYETAPVGGIPQGDFLNAAAGLVVSLSAEELMAAAKGIECAMGREPGPRWGPRLIDLDILLYGDAEIRTDDLVVPHPELWNRLFVLGPLSDILPPGHLADRVQQRMREIDGEQRIEPYRPRPRQP
jgi:2-amino-4-hydroxy-6-hydroxymethyldihydropteridine diphosphokinase